MTTCLLISKMTNQITHYCIPREILDKFNQQVPNGKKSKTITILIKQFLKEKSVGKNQSLQQGFSENHSAKKGVSNV